MSRIYLYHAQSDLLVAAAASLGRQGHDVCVFSAADDLLQAALGAPPDVVVAAADTLTDRGEPLAAALQSCPETAGTPFLAVDATTSAAHGLAAVHPSVVARVAAELLAAAAVRDVPRTRRPGGASLANVLRSRASRASAEGAARTRGERRAWAQ